MWVELHRPRTVSEMVGNEDGRFKFMQWLRKWSVGEKPALLIGPPGVGKTTLVHLAADELGFRVFELNASDVRTKERLESKMGPLLNSRSLLGERVLLFLDEVDGLHGRQDYGGLAFVLEIATDGRIPLVMAANAEDEKVRRLVAKSYVLRFKAIPPRLVELYVEAIIRKEGFKVEDQLVKRIVTLARGDVRATLNTIQVLAYETKAEPSQLLAERDRQLSAGEGLSLLFEASSRGEAIGVTRRIDLQPREKVKATVRSIVESQLPSEEIAKGINALYGADKLVGRIERTQEWRLLRYLDRLIAHSTYDSIPRRSVKYSEDELPWSLRLRVWNDAKALREICLSVARAFHVSRRDVVSIFLPYLALILSRGRGDLERFAGQLGLDDPGKRVLEKEVERVKLEVGGT